MMNGVGELRRAARALARSPRFTVFTVACLGVGIGLSSTVFSLVDAVLLRPLPYRDPDRLVVVSESRPEKPDPFLLSPLTFAELKVRSGVLSGLSAMEAKGFNLAGEGEPERVEGCAADAELLRVLGVSPYLGRGFDAVEDAPGRHADVALVGYGLWQRRFGGSIDVIGHKLILDGRPHTVIGIMPPGFRAPDKAELWVPLALDPGKMPQRIKHSLTVVGRLRSGSSTGQVGRALGAVAEALGKDYPKSNAGWGLGAKSVRDDEIGDFSSTLLALQVAVLLLVLIVCANVAGLELVRASRRWHETAVRTALGAGRLALIRPLLAESLLLAALGCGVGIAVAALCLKPLATLISSAVLTRPEVRLDARVLVFAVATAALTAVVFSLAPGLQLTHPDLSTMLKGGERTSTDGRWSRRLQALLAICEVALATTLMISAGLTTRTLLAVAKVPPGFDPGNLLEMDLVFPAAQFPVPKRVDMMERLLAEIQSLPGVAAAGASSTVPLHQDRMVARFSVEGRPPVSDNEVLQANHRRVSPGYLRAMRIPLLEGRSFAAGDSAESPRVAIVSRELAHRFWPGQSALGKRLKRGDPESKEPWMSVVGVAEDVKELDLRELPTPTWYLPFTQHEFSAMTIVVRASSPAAALMPAIRARLRRLDPMLPLYRVAPMRQAVADSVGRQRLVAVLLEIYAGLALLMAAIGIYAVLSYAVASRRGELALRGLLGATPGSLTLHVLRDGLRIALLGLAAGLLGSAAVGHLLSSMLFGVRQGDAPTFAAAIAILFITVLAACLIPSRSALKVSPSQALRGL